MQIRTDLAAEARELWEKSAGKTTELPGVEAHTRSLHGFETTTVQILDERGAYELCKPVGAYVTVELDAFLRREEEAFERGAQAVAEELKRLLRLSPGETVLVAGVGNPAVTPDALGPAAARYVMATRHLARTMPEEFGGWRRVSVLGTGVLGTTGMESAELVGAVCDRLRPDRVVVIDALCSGSVSRVCRTVQLTDAGIVPGSGVGNARAALNSRTLGVPVVAVGVPTVTDAATVAAELVELAGMAPPEEEKLRAVSDGLIVTPREIDVRIRETAKLLGYAVDLALHDGLTVGDVDMFVD